MATSYADSVNAFYLAYYGRPADPAGLAFWVDSLQKSNGNLTAITTAFGTSAEATARFGTDTVTDRVADVYQQLFNRAPDAAGLAYWTATIASGKISLADAAIQIMNGAQSSDAQLSTLRQQAAAAFTAEVAASGVAYSGTAAIQAAQVLISAVTLDTKPADVTSLVKATASLVQTAHDNPAILTALAGSSGDLTTLLTSASGKADPVGMVQALASIGHAALTDSAGLSTLLQGGGVAGLVASLPAGTTLATVATAVNSGGLSAGTAIATPSAAAAPVAPDPIPVINIAFVGPDSKDLPLSTTLVANSIYYFIDVQGRPANASATLFQVSKNGIDGWSTMSEDATLADGTYYVRYVVTSAENQTGTSNVLKLVMDHTVAWPTVQLTADTGNSTTDTLTNNGQVRIGGLHPNETWTWSYDGKTWTQGTADANGAATIAAPTTDGAKTLMVRTLETVNGQSQFTSTAFKYTLDTSAPAQGLKLATVQGAVAGSTHTTLTSADVVFSYTGKIDITNGDALFYHIGNGDWIRADSTVIDTVNKTFTIKGLDLSKGDQQIFLETKDAAGNVLDVNVTISGPKDTTPPVAPTVALFTDTGTSATDRVTNIDAVKVSGLEAGATWEYSRDGGAHWITGPAQQQGFAILQTGVVGTVALQVRSTDTAGNVSPITSYSYTFEQTPTVNLTLAGTYGAEVTTNNANLSLQTMVLNHVDDVTKSYQISTTTNAADFHAWNPATPLADGTYYFRATGADAAGNAYTSNTLTIHLDTTPPPAPTAVQLAVDTGTVGDGITSNGSFTVSGMAQGTLWEYSSNGTNWFTGGPVGVDGTAAGFAPVDGEQTLQARTYDLAGNHSAAVSLHFTLDSHRPADGLKLDHIGTGGANSINGAQGDSHTALATPDVVFKYTGTINAGDSFFYTLNPTGASTVWTAISADMIDTSAKTITFHNFDLSHADAYITIKGTDAAGTDAIYQQSIDGPFTSWFTQNTAAGPQLQLSAQFTAHAYLTDGSNAPVQIHTLDASGDLVNASWVTLGVQNSAVHGVLGAGNDALVQTVNSQTAIYSLGTATGDTLSGSAVWGYGGDDVITATGGTGYKANVLSGGAGADQLHVAGVSSEILFGQAQDSAIGAGATVAHGYDTVFLGGSANTSLSEVLTFENTPLTAYYHLTGSQFTGTETGDALLGSLNTAVASSFQANVAGQAALISAGVDANGKALNFFVVDADKDGHITSADFVVKIVGSIDASSIYTSGVNGALSIDIHALAL